MAKLIASTFIGNGSLWLFLDNNLIMQNSDTLSVEMGDNQDYVIQWFVQGAAGSSYAITISSPRDAQFQFTRGIGKSGKDFGGFRFKT